MPQGILSIVVGVELSLFMGAMVAWSFALARKSRGEPFHPYEPRRPVPWGLFDLALLAFVALLVISIASTLAAYLVGGGLGGAAPQTKPVQFALSVFISSSASLAVIAGAIVFLAFRVRAGLHDFGIEPDKVESDVGLGMIAFIMISVPVFMIQVSLKLAIPEQDEHPLIDMLQADSSPLLMFVCFFAAVIVAPFVEEYFFRVLLQGWLENVACRLGDTHGLLFGGCALGDEEASSLGEPDEAEDSPDAPAPVKPGAADVAGGDAGSPVSAVDDNPYISPPAAASGSQSAPAVKPGQLRPRYWPILVSAGLFAAMHIGHGYAPIPLFFLAIGLGYLYQQTHRIIPCIVVHLLLNATSILFLWLSITYGIDM